MNKLISKVYRKAVMLINDQRGMELMTLLSILGISLLLLGGTYMVARTPITTWWNNKIMTLFPSS